MSLAYKNRSPFTDSSPDLRSISGGGTQTSRPAHGGRAGSLYPSSVRSRTMRTRRWRRCVFQPCF